MRIPLACLLMLLAIPASAQIYSYTDANGNKVFTNQPPDGIDAAPVQLQPMNTMDPTRVAAPAQDAEAVAAPVDGQSLPYSQVQLTDLPTDEALRANNGTFTVRAALQPGLMPGHRLQLLLDGQPYGSPTNVPLLQLTEIDRGDHTLELQVKAGDKVIQQSMPVTFTVQRVALGTPKATPRPTP
ncbi:DUF4124 domain-containing protein [Pseudomonas sp. N040]|uniref:DUF4124 domain-containing protein n=1 Tax=Pseudomonas sp. N040 TaxID=2785325 RepID=UPI0018A315D5|nr:DUF4124 domain-containing protein [Pseudomonas sp. N040]MBF7728575.1 DUF4124 domain-containing protein [Pseudomonas sp. N040]MBW7012215.1 DUF4124 domain-containing protein [Pseudomonas sp. N040]